MQRELYAALQSYSGAKKAKLPRFLHTDSEDSLGAHAVLLVLSCCGSYLVFPFENIFCVLLKHMHMFDAQFHLTRGRSRLSL